MPVLAPFGSRVLVPISKARPGVPSSALSSFLAPSSTASFLLLVVRPGAPFVASF